MMFLNEMEIEDYANMYHQDELLGPAVKTLVSLMEWTNENSDGWAYWPKPCRAARRLQELLQRAQRHDRGWDVHRTNAADVRAAIAPVKAFRTRMRADFLIYEVVQA